MAIGGYATRVHRTANILDKLPKSQQSQAKSALQEIYLTAQPETALTNPRIERLDSLGGKQEIVPDPVNKPAENQPFSCLG
ncbi:MAG: hypothetical protein EA367_21300 [Leptolyngbya sp. DLM2.Bin15]|nr:MAG: hypothetical protein EA367_21300 [Leptolyngbya sp. DLM2.Bin15]